jgi:hypothetical protein
MTTLRRRSRKTLLNAAETILSMKVHKKTPKPTLVNQLNAFIGFGMINSHIYRAKLTGLFMIDSIGKIEALVIIFLATVVKSRKRTLTDMERFSDRAWFRKVHDFYTNVIVFRRRCDKAYGRIASP